MRLIRLKRACVQSGVWLPATALLDEDFFHAAREIGHFNGHGRPGRQEASYHTFSLRDLNLVVIAEEIFHNGEAVREVTNG